MLLKCDWCGDDFEKTPRKTALKRYCSRECQASSMRGGNVGREFIEVTKSLRRAFIESCKQGVGKTRWTAEEAAALTQAPLDHIRSMDNVAIGFSDRIIGKVLYHKDMDMVFYQES